MENFYSRRGENGDYLDPKTFDSYFKLESRDGVGALKECLHKLGYNYKNYLKSYSKTDEKLLSRILLEMKPLNFAKVVAWITHPEPTVSLDTYNSINLKSPIRGVLENINQTNYRSIIGKMAKIAKYQGYLNTKNKQTSNAISDQISTMSLKEKIFTTFFEFNSFKNCLEKLFTRAENIVVDIDPDTQKMVFFKNAFRFPVDDNKIVKCVEPNFFVLKLLAKIDKLEKENKKMGQYLSVAVRQFIMIQTMEPDTAKKLMHTIDYMAKYPEKYLDNVHQMVWVFYNYKIENGPQDYINFMKDIMPMDTLPFYVYGATTQIRMVNQMNDEELYSIDSMYYLANVIKTSFEELDKYNIETKLAVNYLCIYLAHYMTIRGYRIDGLLENDEKFKNQIQVFTQLIKDYCIIVYK